MEKEKATEVTGCKQCNEGFSNRQRAMLFVGFYMVGSTVYATVELVKYIFSIF
jgi:hypothetical protein